MFNLLKQVWSVIEKNRFSVIVPVLGIGLWFVAIVSCTPTTQSPLHPDNLVTSTQLEQDYQIYIVQDELIRKKFVWAADDIAAQKAKWNEVEKGLMTIASGSVTSWAGLFNILLSSGIIGFAADNIRKKGVIDGLKRNA